MGENAVWAAALAAIARHYAMTYWQMKSGASFHTLLSPLATILHQMEPFGYAAIESVTVFREARDGGSAIGCDWDALTAEIRRVPGLKITPIRAKPWPDSPPTDALRLSVK